MLFSVAGVFFRLFSGRQILPRPRDPFRAEQRGSPSGHGVEQLFSPQGVLSNGLVLCIAGDVGVVSTPAIDTSPLTNGLGLLGINDISSIFPRPLRSDARQVLLASRLAHTPGGILYAT
jgi:hypothetical protein